MDISKEKPLMGFERIEYVPTDSTMPIATNVSFFLSVEAKWKRLNSKLYIVIRNLDLRSYFCGNFCCFHILQSNTLVI